MKRREWLDWGVIISQVLVIVLALIEHSWQVIGSASLIIILAWEVISKGREIDRLKAARTPVSRFTSSNFTVTFGDQLTEDQRKDLMRTLRSRTFRPPEEGPDAA